MHFSKNARPISASSPDVREGYGRIATASLLMRKTFGYWLLAIRPKTLSISVVPVLLGCALAWSETRQLDLWLLAITLVAAILIQIGTNLHNDVADFEKGSDRSTSRLGPPRATAEGWLTASQVRLAAFLSFGLAFLVGCYLVWRGGWPILTVGIASIAAGLAYTGGPRPLAYRGMGEIFVLLFFGLVAVGGTYFLQTGGLSAHAVLMGAIIGMPAAAVLVVNNYRDQANDRKAGKHTLAVRYGNTFSRAEYAMLMLIPFIMLAGLWFATEFDAAALLPWIALPWALMLVRRFWVLPIGPAFNSLLAATAVFQLVFGILISIALLVASRSVDVIA
jgi:1,4-dihydroxy-2-naphthoate octaprenyltransferase